MGCIPKDYIGFSTNPKMWVLIDECETLMFADKIKKFNQSAWKQDRIMLVTTENVYNVKKDKVKRRIKIGSLIGVSKALLGAKIEFTLHVQNEYDYRFQSEKRNEIVDAIKRAYAEKFKKNLPVYGIEKEKLQDFTTTEKDFKRGISKFPPKHLRI